MTQDCILRDIVTRFPLPHFIRLLKAPLQLALPIEDHVENVILVRIRMKCDLGVVYDMGHAPTDNNHRYKIKVKIKIKIKMKPQG